MLHELDDLLLDGAFRPLLCGLRGVVSGAALARCSLVGVLLLQSAVLAWDLRMTSDPVATLLVAAVTLGEFIVAGLLQAEIDLAEDAARCGEASPARARLRPFRFIVLLMLVVATGVWLRSDCQLADCCSLAAIGLWFCALFLVSADRAPVMLTLPEFRLAMPRAQALRAAREPLRTDRRHRSR